MINHPLWGYTKSTPSGGGFFKQRQEIGDQGMAIATASLHPDHHLGGVGLKGGEPGEECFNTGFGIFKPKHALFFLKPIDGKRSVL